MEEKVLEKLNILEKKLDELIALVKGKKMESVQIPIESRKPSMVASQLAEEKADMSMLESERIICPKCQSVNIQAMDNKEKPLSMSGGIKIYSKRYYCKKCGYQWE